jgi:RNA polymerase sigma-70 factor (ECF subfamily)
VGNSVFDRAVAAEARLVTGLRKRDETSVRAFVDDLDGTMISYLCRSGASRHLAEDIVQDAWLSMLERVLDFEGRSTVKTWMWAILTNRAARSIGRERRSTPFSALVASACTNLASGRSRNLLESLELSALWTTAPATGDEPHEAAVAHELLERVVLAARDLPARQRAALVLHLLGFSNAESSLMLGVTAPHQRVLLHRARTRLRAALEAAAGSTPDSMSACARALRA